MDPAGASEACGARALARAIREIKLDLALVLFAFALALYLEVLAGRGRFRRNENRSQLSDSILAAHYAIKARRISSRQDLWQVEPRADSPVCAECNPIQQI